MSTAGDLMNAACTHPFQAKQARNSLLASFLLLALLPAGSAHAQAGTVSFSLPPDPNAIVVRMQEESPALGAQGPSITVFASGRVLVEYPDTMRRAGRYEMQLTDQELRQRIRGWLRKDIGDFDGERARERLKARKREREQAEGVFYHVSDASVTSLEIHLPEYRGRRSPAGARGVRLDKQIRWRALRSDAKRYPNVSEVQHLSDVAKDLQALMESPELERVE